MTSVQIIGIVIVALLGLYIFYCIYDLGKFNKKERPPEGDQRPNARRNHQESPKT